MKPLLVKCPSVQWQPDGLTVRTKKWSLGAGVLGAPPISSTLTPGAPFQRRSAAQGVRIRLAPPGVGLGPKRPRALAKKQDAHCLGPSGSIA